METFFEVLQVEGQIREKSGLKPSQLSCTGHTDGVFLHLD